MTGANRLLIGVGWPVVALTVWYREGRTSIELRRERSGDVVWLLAATLYSAIIPLKGTLAWFDALILFAIYAIYVLDPDTKALVHTVSLRELMLAKRSQPVSIVGDRRAPLSVHPKSDREEVARVISEYNLLAVPWVA